MHLSNARTLVDTRFLHAGRMLVELGRHGDVEVRCFGGPSARLSVAEARAFVGHPTGGKLAQRASRELSVFGRRERSLVGQLLADLLFYLVE